MVSQNCPSILVSEGMNALIPLPLAFQKVFFPVQSFCRNDIFLTFPRTGFSHFVSPQPPQKPGEIDWYPGKWGWGSGEIFYIPEWMTPNTSHNNKGKLCYDIPGKKPHYIYQYMACLGESWVNHDFTLFFFYAWTLFSQKSPDFRYFPRAIILRILRTFGRQVQQSRERITR